MLTTYLILFIVALGTTILTTPAVRWVALHYNVIDLPGARKVHTVLIPRFGGVSIYIGIVVTLFLGSQFLPDARDLIDQNTRLLSYLMIGATSLCIVGAADDKYGLSARKKLIVQIIAAVLSYSGGLRLHFFEEAGFNSFFWIMIDLISTVCWIVVITNAINLIDGLDGLAAGITTIIVLILSGISYHNGFMMTSLIAIVTAGSVIGFLRYNIFPAKIFLGDSGSLLLGYLLANLTLNGTQQESTLTSLVIALLLLSVPLVDTFLAIARRFMKGQGIFSADGNHIHHKLLNRGIEHPITVMILWGMNLIFAMAAFIFTVHDMGPLHKPVNIFSVLILGFLAAKFASKEINDVVNSIRNSNRRRLSPRKKNLMVRRVMRCLKETKDFNNLEHQLVTLAEKIGLDFMHIEITVDDKISRNELVIWERSNDDNHDIIKTSSIHKRRDGIVCKVDLGKQKLKSRRKSEDDQIWADTFSSTIADVYSKMPYANRQINLQPKTSAVLNS